MKKAIIFLLFLVHYHIFVFSSDKFDIRDFSFKHISLEQGLPGTNLIKQYQDSKGIMWISIEAMGICRYTGHEFELFQNNLSDSNSISSNFINDINEDSKGNLWLATDNGLNYYVREKRAFSVLRHQEGKKSLNDNIVNCIVRAGIDHFWIGTANGMALFNSSERTFFRYLYVKNDSNISTGISIQCILPISDTVIWLGTNIGLLKFNPLNGQYKKWRLYAFDNENAQNINDIVSDINNNLWLATPKGLFKFDSSGEEFVDLGIIENETNRLLGTLGVNSLFIDHRNWLWVGTYTSGLYIINMDTKDNIKINSEDQLENPLSSNNIKYIFQDKDDIIWLGTKFEGLFKYESSVEVLGQWSDKYRLLKELNDKYIMSFFEDKNDILWLGTKFEGIYRIDLKNQVIKNYQSNVGPSNNYLSSNRVTAIYRDSKNRFWVGTNNGLDILNEKSESFSHVGNVPINKIVEDDKGNLWLGSLQGVYIIDETILKPERFEKKMKSDFFYREDLNIVNIFQDSRKNIWFSSKYSGLYRYSPDQNQIEDFASDIDDLNAFETEIMTRSILEDEFGNIWICTKDAGLLKYNYDGDKITRFTVEDGLPSNFILAIQEDNEKNLWLGTYNGLSRFDHYNNIFSNFNHNDGLKSDIAELGVTYKLNDGSLLFGGNNGFNIFNPADILINDSVASIVITSIKTFEHILYSDIDQSREIKLKYDQNYLSFDFSLVDYKDPYRHQFECYLEGLDNEWNSLGNNNKINYTNLDPGKYALHVRGANEFGIWNHEPLIVKIHISPPFFATLGFRIFAFIAISLALILLYLQKDVQARKSKEILELQIRERTKKLENANEELLAKNEMIEQQKQEIEMHHSRLESKVAERTLDLERAKKKAEESDRLKTAFLANMSHEIRTPINAITGFSTLIEDGGITDKDKNHYIKLINENTLVLLKLIEDILDISKIEAGQIRIKKDLININSLFQDIYLLFYDKINTHTNKKDIKFIWKNSSSKSQYIAIYTDLLRLKQIIVNIINNAIKYTHKGEVVFGYEINGADLKIMVKDTGIGISKSDQDIIFNRFVKIEEKSALYRGTGIGLSISKGLTELLGGEIHVESEVNEGSLFEIRIPKVVDSQFSDKRNTVLLQNQKLDIHGKSILVVEDEDSNFFLLNSYLKKTGVNIMRAVDGEDALSLCKTNRFDLILMDIKLPKLNGYETVAMLRKRFPKLPIIAQTAYAMVEDRKKIIDAGFDDYLAKPIMKRDLIEKIRAHINQ